MFYFHFPTVEDAKLSVQLLVDAWKDQPSSKFRTQCLVEIIRFADRHDIQLNVSAAMLIEVTSQML